MPVQSSETYRGRTLTRTLDGKWIATRVWEVTGATNENQALSASPIDGSPIAQLGNSHPQSTLLMVDSVTGEQQAPFYWLVTARYTIPPDQSLSSADASKLLLPVSISIRTGRISVAVDRDCNGRHRVNSAGDAFNPPGQRVLTVRYLRAVRWELFYNVVAADTYENRVNSNAMNIGGKIAVAPQRLYCESIDVAEDFPANAIALPIAYSFILRKDLDDAPHPFNDYVKDQGRRGYYSNNGTATLGEFFHADGTQCTEDIPLDGAGKPIDTTIKVSSTLQTAVSNPNPPAITIDPFFSGLTNGRAKYIEFQNAKTVDFSSLNL